DDTPKSHPRMGGSAHRAMFARSVDSGLRAFLGCHVGGGPAGKLEFRVPRQVASGHAVAILGEDLSVPGDEDRAEGFVTRRECLARKFDGAAQVLQFNIIHHASSHARPAGGERGASDSPYHGGEGRGGRSAPAAKRVLTWGMRERDGRGTSRYPDGAEEGRLPLRPAVCRGRRFFLPPHRLASIAVSVPRGKLVMIPGLVEGRAVDVGAGNWASCIGRERDVPSPRLRVV